MSFIRLNSSKSGFTGFCFTGSCFTDFCFNGASGSIKSGSVGGGVGQVGQVADGILIPGV